MATSFPLSFNMQNRKFIGAFWLLLAIAFVGCGKAQGPWGKVTGVVLNNGQPVEPAIVLFSNRDLGVEITAETDGAGRFTMRTDRIDGLPVGTYRVAISPKPTNLPVPEQGMMFNGPPPVIQSKIAEDDRDIATTRHSADVREGENAFRFDVKP